MHRSGIRPDSHVLGASIQYLHPGQLQAKDDDGNNVGIFFGSYGAYSLAYGQQLTNTLSVGFTGEFLRANIADVSANAFAADIGVLYTAASQLTPTFDWAGYWIKTVNETGGSTVLDLKNDEGEPVASGYYLYTVTAPGNAMRTGTLAVVR